MSIHLWLLVLLEQSKRSLEIQKILQPFKTFSLEGVINQAIDAKESTDSAFLTMAAAELSSFSEAIKDYAKSNEIQFYSDPKMNELEFLRKLHDSRNLEEFTLNLFAHVFNECAAHLFVRADKFMDRGAII